MIIKKTLLTVIGATMLLSLPFSAMAAESNNTSPESTLTANNTAKVFLNKIAVKIPNANKIRTEKTIVSPNETILKVYDIATGALLETYGEIDNQPTIQSKNNSSIAPLAGSYTVATVYKDQDFGPLYTPEVVRVQMQLNIYSSGSFRQINSILTQSVAIVSSSGSTLEDKSISSVSTSGSFPTTEVLATGTGTITKKMTNTTQEQLYFGVGFSIGGSASTSKDWYARKAVSVSYDYSLY